MEMKFRSCLYDEGKPHLSHSMKSTKLLAMFQQYYGFLSILQRFSRIAPAIGF